MSEVHWEEEVAGQVWRLQLIVGALVTGSLTFLGIVLFLVHFGAIPQGEAGEADLLLSYILLAFTLGAVAARAVLPPSIVSNARRRIRDGTFQPTRSGAVPVELQAFLERTGDAGRLWQVFLARAILAAAILEGVAFFACITYMIEHSVLSLLIAMALIASLALHVPTQAGVIHWIEEQLRLLDEERQLGPR
jgi:hypothetical protein